MWTCDDDRNKKCLNLFQRDSIYIVIILMLIIVVMATKFFGSNQKAIDLFSFASTITSMILSVLAIFMTLISEYKSENAKSKVEEATNKVANATDELVKTQNQLQGIQDRFNSNISDYKNVAEKLDKVLEGLKSLEMKTEHIQNVIETVDDLDNISKETKTGYLDIPLKSNKNKNGGD